ELKGHYNTEFKVIVRTTNYETGYKLMKKVFKLLTLDNHFVEGMHIKQCYPDNEPIEYPISEGNTLELASDFKIAFSEIT
ncbi:minor capsid protein, partial [Acinetobacter baumannii]